MMQVHEKCNISPELLSDNDTQFSFHTSVNHGVTIEISDATLM